MLATVSPVAAEELVPVPFVGCQADGQQGPIEPAKDGPTPSVPKAVADQLAYYSANNSGVLAPRGWRCAQVYGADGSELIVIPADSKGPTVTDGPSITDPIVSLEIALGSTSGRFTVASIAGPLFPVAKKFVQGVLHEPETHTKLVSIANDRLTRRSATVVEFVTPARKQGLGIDQIMLASDLPVSGVAILLPEEDMNLVMLRVRLPPALAGLSAIIVAQTSMAVSQCRCSSSTKP